MKWINLVFVAILITLIQSCTNSVHWTHSSANKDQTLIEIRDCQKLAKEKVGTGIPDGSLGGIGAKQYLGTNGAYQLRQREELGNCMEGKGYIQTDVQDR